MSDDGGEAFFCFFFCGGCCGEGLVLGVVEDTSFIGVAVVLGRVAIGGLTFLVDFLLFEVPIFSFFLCSACSFIQFEALLSFLSFFFFFSKVISSTFLFRVSSIPFLFPASEALAEDFCLAGSGCGCTFGFAFESGGNFLSESFSP
ncbi:hypothetical protein Hanom_Chr11g01013521 [Helianthus anomalus]